MSWDIGRIFLEIHICDATPETKGLAWLLLGRLNGLVTAELINIPEPTVSCADGHIEFGWDHVPDLELWFMWTPPDQGRTLTLVYHDEHIRMVKDPTDEQIVKYLRRLVPGDE